MKTYIHDPDAVLDYGFDWTTDDWLDDGETIATSTWTVPTGITKVDQSNTGTITAIWISGGTDGQFYRVINHIVTSEGREDDRSFFLRVKDR